MKTNFLFLNLMLVVSLLISPALMAEDSEDDGPVLGYYGGALVKLPGVDAYVEFAIDSENNLFHLIFYDGDKETPLQIEQSVIGVRIHEIAKKGKNTQSEPEEVEFNAILEEDYEGNESVNQSIFEYDDERAASTDNAKIEILSIKVKGVSVTNLKISLK